MPKSVQIRGYASAEALAAAGEEFVALGLAEDPIELNALDTQAQQAPGECRFIGFFDENGNRLLNVGQGMTHLGATQLSGSNSCYWSYRGVPVS